MGKAKNLKKRVTSYFQKQYLGPKNEVLVSKIKEIKTISVTSEVESLLLEANLVKKYSPKFNIRLTDGKAYPLIRITNKNMYPSVLIARRPDDPKSLYFGPFPNAGDMKLVLRTIRRIFPFISVLNHPKKHCLYWHLGLCPCTPAQNSDAAIKEYKKTTRYIIQFLKGNIKTVSKELLKEQQEKVKNEEFEEASTIQKKIKAIELITSPNHSPFEFEENPNLKNEIFLRQANDLQNVLNSNGLQVEFPERIECYDISNISGTNATGSMVVFVNGQADKSQYRRFRIKMEQKPNDFAMMKEVLSRRFKHDEWSRPDLIVIDGGKGQVSSASSILDELKLNIPLIGLAKRVETIVLPNFDLIQLPRRSDALTLLVRIRNEAHRFAITYHKKLRSKTFIN